MGWPNKAERAKNHHMDYSYIWTDSRAEYMHYFLTYSRQLTQEEVDLIEEEGEKAVKKQYPALEQFKEQIDFYEGLHEQLKHIDNTKTVLQWFRSDMRPFKQSLLNNIKRYILLNHPNPKRANKNDRDFYFQGAQFKFF